MPELPSQDHNPRESRRVLIFLSLALAFLIVSATLGGILFASSAGIQPNTILAKLRMLTLSREKKLAGENTDRINILLLGMGGAGHEGATLTDTIILASLRPSDKKVALLSIPRDLQVNIPGYGYRKINSVNAYAEQTEAGSGSSTVATTVTNILSQPIHYYLRLDFEAFKEIIDSVNGIEINVEQSFYDPFYPDDNFKYAPVAFEAGRQKMNGDRALKFARSRHGTNGEGSDFARARRQQKILSTLKERLLSFDVLLRPARIKNILESLNSHIQTNLTFWEGLRLTKLFKSTGTENIINRVLDASPAGVLIERNYNGAFVLEPKNGNWDEVKAVVAGLFNKETAKPSPSPLPKEEGVRRTGEGTPMTPTTSLPTVEIQNGTFTVGLAAKMASQLETKGFNPTSIGNAPLRDVGRTIVYDLTGGKNPDALDKLKTTLQAIDGEGEPNYLITRGTLDFLVILGKNAIQ